MASGVSAEKTPPVELSFVFIYGHYLFETDSAAYLAGLIDIYWPEGDKYATIKP